LNGCNSEPNSINISVKNCDIEIPTAITPDGDNVNDVWILSDIDQIYPENIVSIFDSWGGLVFTSDKGLYETNPWNGKIKEKILPVDSYYYLIEFNDGKTPSAKGSISIILNR